MTVITSFSEHDTPEIVELRQAINDADTEFSELARAHRLEQRKRMDRYDALLAARRPSFPTPTQLEAFDQIVTFIREGTAYGDFLGYPTHADTDAGRALPVDVQFSAADARINVLARAPKRVQSTARAWELSEADVTALRAELEQRSLKVLSHWIHDDGVAFIVAVDKR